MGFGDYPKVIFVWSIAGYSPNPAGSFSGMITVSVDADTSATYAVAPSATRPVAFFTRALRASYPFSKYPYIGVYPMGFDAGFHMEVCTYGVKIERFSEFHGFFLRNLV